MSGLGQFLEAKIEANPPPPPQGEVLKDTFSV